MKKARITFFIIIISFLVFRSMFIKKDSSKDIKDKDYFKTTVRGSYLTDVLTDEMYSDRDSPAYIKLTKIDSKVQIKLAWIYDIKLSYNSWVWYDSKGVYEVSNRSSEGKRYVLLARQPIYKLTNTVVEGYWAEDYEEDYDWGE